MTKHLIYRADEIRPGDRIIVIADEHRVTAVDRDTFRDRGVIEFETMPPAGPGVPSHTTVEFFSTQLVYVTSRACQYCGEKATYTDQGLHTGWECLIHGGIGR